MAAEGTQHPLRIYWIMWGALFVLSTFSYATDFMDDGTLRTSLILLFMFATWKTVESSTMAKAPWSRRHPVTISRQLEPETGDKRRGDL
mgnify:CR=1 FL=1